MQCTAACLSVLALLSVCWAQKPCILITPSVLHVATPETFVLESQQTVLTAEILIRDFPRKETSLGKATVSLNGNNNYLEKAEIKISGDDFPKDSMKKQFVVVTVQSEQCKLEKIVLLTFQSGYIFIQTDKTLYTPGSKVLYRLFITQHTLQSDSRAVDVEIINPDNIVVDKPTHFPLDKSGIVSTSFNLPEIANAGMWQIVARFQMAPQEMFRTEFECKEYVLPSFEVLLEPSQPYFYTDDNEFSVDITARFLHGKDVQGSGYVMFGAMVGNVKMNFPDSLTKIEVVDGSARAVLERFMILRRFPNLSDLLGSYLYITVTVVTNAGSDMVEAEKSGIPIVDKAFKILFPKSPRYFKPGLPYTLWISLQNPDGSPASNVNICSLNQDCSISNSEGIVQLILNHLQESKVYEIKFRTEGLNVPDHRQATATFTLQPYKPQGKTKNYLHINIPTSKLNLHKTYFINFYVKGADVDLQITYLVLSKGRIVDKGRSNRQKGQSFVATSLTVTKEFMPSFRIVAYYIGEQNEIVSDSVWVDVLESCMGTIEFGPNPDKPFVNPEPSKGISMKITGDPGAYVGLVAVDKAVFVLNKKNRISQPKIWKEVEQSDLGCTPGGGSDSAGVFTDAGLSVVTNVGLSNPTREELQCPQSQKRRRSVPLTGLKAKKVKEYTDDNLRRCCEDGMQENPMGYSCDRRAQYVLEAGECVVVFLECCKYIYESPPIRGPIRRPMKRPIINSFIHFSQSATTAEEDDSYMDLKDITSRSIFSESWLWKIEKLPDKYGTAKTQSKTLAISLPDSITTWEFLAVSLSSTTGICVAEPYELMVKKYFFIDLRIPYAVVRNEQVEIRAVLYSYITHEIEVRIDLLYNKQFCSSATPENDYRQVVKMEPGGIVIVPFVIVPLEIGPVQVEVKAAVKDTYYFDGVVKNLKVVPEGMKIMKNIQSIILEPSKSGSGKQTETIQLAPRADIVPKSDPVTYVSVKGDLVGETLENAIDGSKLSHLIMVPTGCGEQNMMTMTPGVIATHFLDATNQWQKVGLNRREEAINNIRKGYAQQLVYRKSDSSYAAFTNRPASTWLTAYVVKVFAMAYRMTNIDTDVLCGAVKWLTLKQLPDGIFEETAPVIHGEMVGGSSQADPDASLTAFVLIALAEAKEYCQKSVTNLDLSISKSANFLELRLKNLKRPYSVCIVSYALSLIGKLANSEQLMRLARDGTHWADSSPQLYAIEATSYALLTLLKLREYHLAGFVAQWLAGERFYGGGYGSTQATIMVFQALSEFQIHVPIMNDIDMDVEINLPSRSSLVKWRINTDNAMMRRSEQTSMEGKIEVTAKGKGKGTMTIMSVYYTPMAEGAAECKNFEFSVSLVDAPAAMKPDDALRSMYLNVCMRFLGITDSTMVIVDVSMLTGFTPDTNDLDMLTNRVEKYISKYEMDKERSERGSLIIYLDKVSRTATDCLKFRIHQKFEVGVLQPAAITVYEFYSLENRCTKFYHPTEHQGQLRRICKGAECHCLAEQCNQKNAFKGKLTVEGRIAGACEAGVDYVYEMRLDKIEEKGAYDVFTMTITTLIKLGSDEKVEGEQRRFYSHQTCRDSVTLKKGSKYIAWGQSSDMWDMDNEKSYVITGRTWIEEIPNDQQCAKDQATLCDEISKFLDVLRLVGCSH
ncbi:hypothetical protein GDO86_007014 [Hymenochirus boettgeri]|uniref:Complement C3 n=1 Tax=Hymenochirus boettgeri TaxID=247094 RepID=A0A8T2JG98_9PIPI|nr:hypothetical protein GDO86_007014 [Hymenochirus boettgeri]